MDITFRPATTDDLPEILSAEADQENSRFIGACSEEQHRASLADPDIAYLMVETYPDLRRVGFIIMAGLKNKHGSIEFRRIVITDKGRGYGRKALQAVKRIAFEDMNAHRLWLDVKEFNMRARSLYEQEGFRFEGKLRECRREGDGYSSLILMSILESEYRGLAGQNRIA
jgi:diamine N-acetyltransferase